MDAICNALDWRDESSVVDLIDDAPAIRLLELSLMTADPRRIVDYVPQDVDDAISKLVYLTASIMSGRITLTKSEMTAVLESVDNV